MIAGVNPELAQQLVAIDVRDATLSTAPDLAGALDHEARRIH
jgi:hypothetical protein